MKTRELAYTGILAALIAVCSWISIPTAVPFTLQTFAVFLTLGLLGGRLGTLAVTVYLLLGAVGLPVFAGFHGGLGAFLGATGGYLVGFLFTALTMWGAERWLGKSAPVFLGSAVVGQILCYLFGSVWYYAVYTSSSGRNVHRVGLVCVPLPPARRSQAGAGLAVEPPPGPRPSDQPPLRALA
mgnify:CR=1 FL=1